jgi:hypothetical protein
MDAQCPSWAPSLGYMGVAAAVGLSNWGSAVSSSGVCMVALSGVLDATVSFLMVANCREESERTQENSLLRRVETQRRGKDIAPALGTNSPFILLHAFLDRHLEVWSQHSAHRNPPS